ncbi:MAG: hydrogenase expression/formation protein HypE [Bdellovibrionales bacterium RIFOXYD1_FULL_53_11]|nr:MAG: hydrogenase expression/formation protein HypE [Bdellovibrionales bacterium RIFOXYD1_FULL_53_11]
MNGSTKPVITLAHGNGGSLMHKLVNDVFVRAFGGTLAANPADSAILEINAGRIAFTTDSHVVTPLFFPGGDIGSLAVNGTVNDLAVMGARPVYLTCGMIIEEGFPVETLERIAASMAASARAAGVSIAAGDTKVVEKGAADGIFINTSGIGVFDGEAMGRAPRGLSSIRPGDAVITSGTIGDHGIAIYAGREGINFETDLKSDCAPVTALTMAAMSASPNIRIMRDPTRGGLATTLGEFAAGQSFGIEIDETRVPVRDDVAGACELLGFDPLYVANEGKIVLIVPSADADSVAAALRKIPIGAGAAIIGRVTGDHAGTVSLRTAVGGHRIVDMLAGDMLPRIC